MTENTESKANESQAEKKTDDLDSVFAEAGEFGKNQIFHFFLLSILVILSAIYAVDYIVTTSTLDYRCKIPGCDAQTGAPSYDEAWLKYAVPYKNNKPAKCSRFNVTRIINSTNTDDDQICPEYYFNKTEIVPCNEFVFKTNEHRIIKEFGIYCDENEYKLALVGTVNNIGGFLLMPLTGILSDKVGRLKVLVTGMMGCCIFGLGKAMAVNYNMYLVFEFLSSALGTCVYLVAFVLGVEWVSSKHRVLGSTIITIAYPLGEILLGVFAIYLEHYRPFLIASYVPGLIAVFYVWLVPESVRWLMVTGKHQKAYDILQTTAKRNNRQLSQKSRDIIFDKSKEEDVNEVSVVPLKTLFKYKVMILRLLACSVCWIAVTHIFYGLSLSSTKIDDDDNKYLSYIIVMMGEIPAAVIVYFLLDRLGRRITMCSAMVIAGSFTIASTFVPSAQTLVIRGLLFIGLTSTSCSFAVLYIFTAEIWPTSFRNTLMNICSMIGRFGSMSAPLTILLNQYNPSLPLIVYGGVAILGGFVILVLPETLKRKLPDTIEEARKM